MFSVSTVAIIADIVVMLGYIASADLDILEQNYSWPVANSLCNLTTDYVDMGDSLGTILQPQRKYWIGRRIQFTDWMVLENCNNYTLHEKSQEFKTESQFSVLECRAKCAGLYINLPYLRFGLTIRDNRDVCVCDDPSATPNFGTISERCEPVNCRSNNVNDFCGERGCLVVYYSDSTLSFTGPGDCGAFRRESERRFVGVALPCFRRLGYLAEDESGGYIVMNSTLQTWEDTVAVQGIGHKSPRLSNRVRPHRSAWGRIPLAQWPVGVSLWVAVTRRLTKQINQDKQCRKNNCYCVAVQRQNDSATSEEMLDCDSEFPSLCASGSIKPLLKSESVVVKLITLTDVLDNTTSPSDVTKSTPPFLSSEGFNPTKLVVLVPIFAIIAIAIGVVFLRRKVCKRKPKRRQYQGSMVGPRVESIYYSEIKAEDVSGYSRQNSSKTTDEDDYDLIPGDAKNVPQEEQDHIYDFVT